MWRENIILRQRTKFGLDTPVVPTADEMDGFLKQYYSTPENRSNLATGNFGVMSSQYRSSVAQQPNEYIFPMDVDVTPSRSASKAPIVQTTGVTGLPTTLVTQPPIQTALFQIPETRAYTAAEKLIDDITDEVIPPKTFDPNTAVVIPLGDKLGQTGERLVQWFPLRYGTGSGSGEERYLVTGRVPVFELARAIVATARQMIANDARIDVGNVGATPTVVINNNKVFIVIAELFDGENFASNVMGVFNAVIALFLRRTQEESSRVVAESQNTLAWQDRFHNMTAGAWQTVVVPFLYQIMALCYSRINRQNIKEEEKQNQWRVYTNIFEPYLNWLFIKGFTGSDKDDSRTRIPSPSGPPSDLWFKTDNTFVSAPLFPPIVAALAGYGDKQPIAPNGFGVREMAAMVPLFVMLALDTPLEYRGYMISRTGTSLIYPVAQLVNGTRPTLYSIYDAMFTNDKWKSVAQRINVPVPANAEKMATEQFGRIANPVADLEFTGFGNITDGKYRSRALVAVVVRDTVTAAAAFEKLYPLLVDRGYMLIVLASTMFVQFRVQQETVMRTLFLRMGVRPQVQETVEGKDAVYSIKSATKMDDTDDEPTVNTGVLNIVRSKLSTTIKESTESKNASIFIRDADTLKDSNGKTLFQIIDDKNAGRRFSVFVPENEWWKYLRAQVPNDADRMRLLKRHVIWTPSDVNFTKLGGDSSSYTTLLSDDNANDSDSTISLAVVKMGRKNREFGLLVNYPFHNTTERIAILNDVTRSKTGRAYFISGVFMLDAKTATSKTGAYQPIPVGPASAEQTVVTQAKMVTDSKELGDIQREAYDLLRKTGVVDEVRAFDASKENGIVIILPSKSNVASLLETRPTAEVARSIALFHVIGYDDFMAAMKMCGEENRSTKIATAGGKLLKFSCGSDKKRKANRLLAADILNAKIAHIQMSGFTHDVFVFRVDTVLMPKDKEDVDVPMLTNEEVTKRVRGWLTAARAIDVVTARAMQSKLGILLPPESEVKALLDEEITDEEVRNKTLQFVVYVDDVTRIVSANANVSSIPTLANKPISIGPVGSCDCVPRVFLKTSKAYTISLDDTPKTQVMVWSVPDLCCCTTTKTERCMKTHTHGGAHAIDIGAQIAVAKAAVETAPNADVARASVQKLASDIRSAGGLDALRVAYPEQNYNAVFASLRTALTNNAAIPLVDRQQLELDIELIPTQTL